MQYHSVVNQNLKEKLNQARIKAKKSIEIDTWFKDQEIELKVFLHVFLKDNKIHEVKFHPANDKDVIFNLDTKEYVPYEIKTIKYDGQIILIDKRIPFGVLIAVLKSAQEEFEYSTLSKNKISKVDRVVELLQNNFQYFAKKAEKRDNYIQEDVNFDTLLDNKIEFLDGINKFNKNDVKLLDTIVLTKEGF